MNKIAMTATVVAMTFSTAAFAGGHSQADNGVGDGKGKGMASDVSRGGDFGKGGASVASGLKGGWGGNAGATGGQVSSGPAATPKGD